MSQLDQFISPKKDKKAKKSKYSFDTSAFIDSWRRYYPKDIFPRIWTFLQEKIDDNTINASTMVKLELNYQQDDLSEFVNQFDKLFVPPDKKTQEFVNHLINHPNFDIWGIDETHQADPFVVALAKTKNLAVVSYENPRRTKNTIPAACQELGVTHLSFIEFLRKEHFTT